MPLFRGVGKTITEQLLALGYRQPNGRPDVRRFCREKDYDKTLFYFWINDKNTPTKERSRLAADLGMSESELLFGVAPKASPAKGRPSRKLRSLLLGLSVAGGLLWPSGSVPAHDGTLQIREMIDEIRLLGRRRRFRWNSGYFGLGMVYA